MVWIFPDWCQVEHLSDQDDRVDTTPWIFISKIQADLLHDSTSMRSIGYAEISSWGRGEPGAAENTGSEPDEKLFFHFNDKHRVFIVTWLPALLDLGSHLRLQFKWDQRHPRSPLSTTSLVKKAFFSDEVAGKVVQEYESYMSQYESIRWLKNMMRFLMKRRYCFLYQAW